MRKPNIVPELTSDAAAEEFLAGDLSALDFRQFRPARFEFARKDATVNMRMPAALLDAIKAQAAARGMPYQRWMREAMEEKVGGVAIPRPRRATSGAG